MPPNEESTSAAPAAHKKFAARAKRIAILTLRGLAVFAVACALAWSSAAIWFDGPAAPWLAALLAGLPAAVSIAAFVLRRARPFCLLISCGLFCIVLGWWLTLTPRDDREWQPDVARPARADFAADTVTIHNIRNFEYRTNDDFTQRWETRSYDLRQIVGLDLFISFWGPTLIAHTIASWEFADGRHLAISIETRKEVHEEYSAVRGFFREYEIYYVVADERDVVGLRAAQRGERIYLYRINAAPDLARALLMDYLETVNQLAARPQWYNALTDNCTTGIRYHFRRIGTIRALSWKLLLNGYLDELLYERGQIDTSVPLAELRRRSDITQRAKSAAGHDDFSAFIRSRD